MKNIIERFFSIAFFRRSPNTCRTITVGAENRTILVNAESRIIDVGIETRIVSVAGCGQ